MRSRGPPFCCWGLSDHRNRYILIPVVSGVTMVTGPLALILFAMVCSIPFGGVCFFHTTPFSLIVHRRSVLAG